MFEKFTEQAINALDLAQEEMRRLGHNFVGSEAILLGLLKEDAGISARVLNSLELQLEDVKTEVEHIVGRGTGQDSEMEFTPRAKRVLELSWDEARQLGHNYIGTEHILLAIVRDCNSAGYKILDNSGIDASKIRPLVLALLPGMPGVRLPSPFASTDASTPALNSSAGDPQGEDIQPKLVIPLPSRFYAQSDEDSFFAWVRSIPAVTSVKGIGGPENGGLELTLCQPIMDASSLRSLIALMSRYGLAMSCLQEQCAADCNKAIFMNPSAYWYASVFSDEGTT
jgi:hypothetical protein